MIENLQFKLLTTLEQMKEVQQLEQDVWKMNPIPVHQTYTASKNGGLILGAYHGDQLIGFTYGFPGFKNGTTYLCSHMLGIHPNYQKHGIGQILKEKQRELAVEAGYSLITWTYDPLESINAYLNLHKLHGIGAHYLENHYGTMTDALNSGLATDRFLVEWWITSSYVDDSERVVKNTSIEKESLLLYTEINSEGLPFVSETVEVSFGSEDSEWIVPIPSNFQAIKQQDVDLAIDWRMKTRHVFQRLLEHGYVAIDLQRGAEPETCYYHFLKKDALESSS
jgi:predicted GNAT superfamily acetyltransferase